MTKVNGCFTIKVPFQKNLCYALFARNIYPLNEQKCFFYTARKSMEQMPREKIIQNVHFKFIRGLSAHFLPIFCPFLHFLIFTKQFGNFACFTINKSCRKPQDTYAKSIAHFLVYILVFIFFKCDKHKRFYDTFTAMV